MRGETSQRLVQQRGRHSSIILKLIEYPKTPVAPSPFGFRESAHRGVPRQQYRSFGLGEREGVSETRTSIAGPCYTGCPSMRSSCRTDTPSSSAAFDSDTAPSATALKQSLRNRSGRSAGIAPGSG